MKKSDNEKRSGVVYDKESPYFINHPLQEGYHYKGVFTSKAYDEAKDTDFLPPEN